MKLNNKVPLLILPVLFLSFLLTWAGLYFIERNSIYSLAHSSAEQEAAELSGSFSQYNLVAMGFIGSIVQSDSLRRFLQSDDMLIKSLALNSGLDDLLKNLENLSSDHFSIIFVRQDGQIEYYYENSLDPFAKPNLTLLQWRKKVQGQKLNSAHHYFQDIEKIALIRTLNRITLVPTSDFESDESLTVIVSVHPKDFIYRSAKLREKGHLVTFYDSETKLHAPTLFEARREVPGLGSLSVKLDKSLIEEDLWRTLWKLGICFIALAILTHVSLQWLLNRYVIAPINRLENEICDIDLDSAQEITIHHSEDEIGNLSSTFAKLYDKLKETYNVTKDLAEKDTLTTLYNRRVFNLILEKLISRAKVSNNQVALLYLDIDNFKLVNDSYGHTAGDTLLRDFAYRLHEVVRGSDVAFKLDDEQAVARLAGDEFAVIIHGYTEKGAVSKVANRLLKLCDNGFTCEAGTFPVSLSIGVASFPKDGQSAEELTVNADSAMYEAKRSGKNAVSYYSKELSDFFRRQQALEVELKRLNFNELELYYMPIIDAKTGSVASLEALVRWFSATLGFVSPVEFIPIAETMGAYHEIDLWVVEESFQRSEMLRGHFGASVKISINISAAELDRADFIEKLQHLVNKYQITPSMFVLEITETFYQEPEHSETKLQLLQSLKEIGFQLAIDDFGSGYTSLMQLVEFPINIVKLDKEFIEKTLASQKETVLNSLIEFCHSQQLRVTAEGIETEVYAQKLKQASCDYLQGYYYSKPLPLDELIRSYAKEGG